MKSLSEVEDNACPMRVWRNSAGFFVMSRVLEGKQGKTALVLAGGGLTGVVYELGALRAIQDLLVDRTVNDFDIYVGTSAGALVCSMLATGISPEIMLKTMTGEYPDLPPITSDLVFRSDYRDLARLGLQLPRTLWRALVHYVQHQEDLNLLDALFSLSEALPPGLYDNIPLEEYVRKILVEYACCDDFRELSQDLNVIATDLDTGERAVFGRHENGHVPISRAVAASSAVPVLYKPVRIDDRDYVDGGLRGNASLDVAIEHGARLVVCINPLVPFDNRTPQDDEDASDAHLSSRGMNAVSAQVSRITLHAGLRYHIKQLRRTHPEVDIILIEPRPQDKEMFLYNIMRYSTRMLVARHGFETVTVQMAERYDRYYEILSRHGIEMDRALVREELAEIQNNAYDQEVIQRVLEARRSGRRRPNRSVRRLNRTLHELDRALADWPSG